MESVKMLVVDDEPDLEPLIRQKFRKQIKESEYQFVFAQNGLDALAKLEDHPDIAVILSDINMPEMDGLTLLQKIEEMNNPALKAVIVSAYGDMENIRAAMNRGAFDFITKPIDFNDLEVTVVKTLRQLEIIRRAMKEHEQLISVQRDLTLATRIQQSILPGIFPPFPNRSEFEIFASMIPAKEVGGDFYDFFFIDEQRLGFVIGDVSGKGMPAAIFMALSRTMLKGIAMQGTAPGEALAQVNRMLIPDSDSTMFVTMFYGILDTKTGEVVYSSGGHNLPYLITAKGETRPLERVGGPLMGKVPDLQYRSQSIHLATGDTLFLYTDGVTEAMNFERKTYDEIRLEESLKGMQGLSLTQLIGGINNKLKEFAGSAPQSDDITMLALRFVGNENG